MTPPTSPKASRNPLLLAYLAQLSQHPLRTKALTTGECFRPTLVPVEVEVLPPNLPQRDSVLPARDPWLPSGQRPRPEARQRCAPLFPRARACQGRCARRKDGAVRLHRLGPAQPRPRRRAAEGFRGSDRTRREAWPGPRQQLDRFSHPDIL